MVTSDEPRRQQGPAKLGYKSPGILSVFFLLRKANENFVWENVMGGSRM